MDENNSLKYLELLLKRFEFLNDLRTVTAQRHVTMFGALAAVIVIVFKLDSAVSPDTTAKSAAMMTVTMRSAIVMAVSFAVTVLGWCVMEYDLRIRQRLKCVVNEILNVAEELGKVDKEKTAKAQEKLDEDRWFFAQITVANALSITLFFASTYSYLISWDAPERHLNIVEFVAFLALFFVALKLLSVYWRRKGKSYMVFAQPAGWLPG